MLLAAQTLKRAFTTDVQPILARARLQRGAAVDPIAVYRKSADRVECANKRPAAQHFGGGSFDGPIYRYRQN